MAAIIKKLKSMVPERYKGTLRPVYSELRSGYYQLKKGKDDAIGRFHKKNDGVAKYSIVSACYNVENYIDDFIKSIVNQSLVFEKNIQLILVDDGSTDSTSEKIQAWIKRFPNNIEYYYKENGGQASARNLGLQYVKHEWVNFADPDDMFGLLSFENVDNFLTKVISPCCMVCFNLCPYYEETGVISESHPLSYKFKDDQTVRRISELGDFIQLSASTVIMKSDVVREYSLKFNPLCRPNFEDANFVNTYLSYCGDESVVFLKKSKYYYRKRASKNSTLDTSWLTKKKFSDVFVYGKLSLLTHWKTKGAIPTFIQNVVIYDCSWHLRYLINRPDRISFLTKDEKTQYLHYLAEVYSYCDKSVIEAYCRPPFVWHYYKVGVLGFFKHQEPSRQIAYIEDFDEKYKEIKIRYFTYDLGEESFLFNDLAGTTRYEKTIEDKIADQVFVRQRIVWVSARGISDETFLTVKINGLFTEIDLKGKKRNQVTVGMIRQTFQSKPINETSPYAHCWLISDRDVQADDNGEHFYRFLREQHPEIKAYFMLNRSSYDWERLKKDGFRLIEFGSSEHKKALEVCDHIVSSHADQYVYDYFKTGKCKRIKYTFLQHGVTKDCLSTWLNSKPISLFICSSQNEYDSIVGDDSSYAFTSKEVKLTGMPRYDRLLNLKGQDKKKVILVMPTWRHSLVGAQISGNIREKNPDFMQTPYAKAWSAFLNSDKLERLTKEYAYEVWFLPHANIQPYVDDFQVPSYIKVMTQKEARIQEVFAESAVMITDYSSVAFDFAYLKKPLIYYQFDQDEVFNKHTHITFKGYFEYERDGFGDVCLTEEKLFTSLEVVLKNDGKLEDRYEERIDSTFTYFDNHNCERVFSEIVKL